MTFATRGSVRSLEVGGRCNGMKESCEQCEMEQYSRILYP